MGDITEVYGLVAALRNKIQDQPVDFDSETTIARHIASSIGKVLAELQITDEEPIVCGGNVYTYSDQRGTWSRVDSGELTTLAQLYDGTYTADPGGKPKRVNISYMKACNIAKSILSLHELQSPRFFDEPTGGIAFKNGFCTVSDYGAELGEHDPEHAATIAFDFECDESDTPPEKWLAFLDSLFANDGDEAISKINVIQEFIGCALAGGNLSVQQQRCMLLLGQGANGKSLMGDLIQDLCFPKGTVTHVSPKRFEHEYSVASLLDSKLNLVSELPETNALESSTFKAIIAGDPQIGRYPYGLPFTVSCRAAHIFSANNLPRTSDTSRGFFRRLIMIEFNENFEDSPFRKSKEDFLKELMPERSRIVAWFLRGAARVMRNGRYTELDSHKEQVTNWRRESDGVYDFMTSCLRQGTGTSTIAELRNSYIDWAERVGRLSAIGERTLSRRLTDLGVVKRRTSAGMRYEVDIKAIREWSDVAN